jgi:hypothetical protein
LVAVEITNVQVGHEEAETEVQNLFTGTRTLHEMASADVINPQPLPHGLVKHLEKHALDDLAKAIHRPESTVSIRSPCKQRCDSFRSTDFMCLSFFLMIRVEVLSFCNFRFCFEVPTGFTLDIPPMVVVPSSDFPYHGIAFGKSSTQFSALRSLQSAESALIEALQRESKSRGLALTDAPHVNIQMLRDSPKNPENFKSEKPE